MVFEKCARTQATKGNLRNRLAELQAGMIQDIVHRFRRGKKMNWKVVRLFFFDNKLTASMFRKTLNLLSNLRNK